MEKERIKRKLRRKKHKKRHGANQQNLWILLYDPFAHGATPDEEPDEERFVESYPEGARWDLYNLRETMKYGGFHEGMVFKNTRTLTVRTVVTDENGVMIFKIEGSKKSAQICEKT